MALTQISTAGVKDDAVTAGKIPANAVGSSEIAADAVTGAKIADDAIDSEHITDGSIDTAHIADNNVTEAKLALNAVTNNRVANGSITNAKIGNGAIDTAKLADDAVTTAKIAAGNITATELGSDSVTGAKIAAGAINNANKIQDSIITGAKIGSGTITDGNLATNSVTTGKIANDAVTVDKVADDAIGVAQLSASGTASSSTFLRGDNAWTAVTSTTINQNGSDRVITGSSTANNLNGQSNFTFDGTNVSIPNGLIHTGDTNTAIRFPAADNISMESGGSEVFRVTPDSAHGSSHAIQLKCAHVVDGAAVTIGGTKGDSAGIARGMLNIRDSNAYNVTDNGGAIGFSAVFNNGGSHTTMSQIEGVKANNTDGNYEGAIDFYTRHHNGNMIKKARIGLNGLSFQSDTAAANCLNDYEEGTWTPVMKDQSGNTYSGGGTITGHYVKVGEMVTVQFSGTSLGSSGMNNQQISIHGIPFTPRETAVAFAQLRYGNNISTAQFGPHVQCDANNSIGSMNKIHDNAGDVKTINWGHMQHSSGYYGIRWTLVFRSN